MFNLTETAIIVNYIQGAKEKGYRIQTQDVEDLFKGTFMSIASFLGQAKNRTQKIALAIKDLKGNLKLAGMVGYHPNENEDLPGNWSFEFTSDEKDLEGVTTYLSTDTQFQKVAAQVLHRETGMLIQGGAVIVQTLFELVVDSLMQWLDTNAKEDEAIAIKQEGCFEATIEVENGEKVIGITPDGPLKVMVKGDGGIEQ